MSKVVGIDLGTTNSVIAAIEGGQPTVLTNSEGRRTTPSIVAYTKKQELLVGQVAKRQAVINPENTFFSIKRFIGSKGAEISEYLKKLPYKIIFDSKDNIKVKCPALDVSFSPEEISAHVLRELVNIAKIYLAQDIQKAVITVPAYFNDSQRQSTMDAGKIAGLEVLRIINEPTAASLAYGLDKKDNEKILVFDLGGGTFDVSILDVGEGIFEVLATAGDINLGGDDFDKILVDWLISEFKNRENLDLKNNIQAIQRLTEAAEKAKVQLSTSEKTIIDIPFIMSDETGPKHIKQELTRQKFEQLSNNLIDRCKIPVEKALEDARLKKSDIDEVVLVGGSTRILAVQNLVKSLTKKEPNQSVNPDEVVAIGAAVQAGILVGEVKDILLLDVTPLSLGIETLGGVLTKIVPRNTTIPVKRSEIFSTAADNQSTVDIHILQGERDLMKDNKSLGTFLLSGIKPAPRGVPQIDVTFDLNVDGLLSVTAKEADTGLEKSVTIEGTSNLDTEEISQMLAEAEKNASSDQEKRKIIDLKIQANEVCQETKNFINNYESKMTDSDKQSLDKMVEELELNIKDLSVDNNINNNLSNILENNMKETNLKLQELLNKYENPKTSSDLSDNKEKTI